jgi:TIR domain
MPSIFLSYRRTDAPGHAGRLYDRLVDRFGEAGVFKDLDSMEPGADFGEVIEETVARCDALIAVIGRDWLAADEAGLRRLDSPEDWVRLEIGNALKRKVRVIPVLVEGARMPSAADLPEDLQALARRHAVELSESAWNPQVRQLIDVLETLVAKPAPQEPPAEPEPPVDQPADAAPRRATPSERGRTRLMSELEARGFEKSPRTDRLFYHRGFERHRVAFGTQVMRIEYQRDDGAWALAESFSLAREADRAVDALEALNQGEVTTSSLQQVVANEVWALFTSDRPDAFRIVESRAQPGDYIQWIGAPEQDFRVEISDPGRNLVPPRPLTRDQLAAIHRLGFSREPDSNFACMFEFSEASLPHIVNVITCAFAEVFGLTEAHQVEVFEG